VEINLTHKIKKIGNYSACETKLGKNGFPEIANRKASKTSTPFFLAVDI
jgi:hypothetical protein